MKIRRIWWLLAIFVVLGAYVSMTRTTEPTLAFEMKRDLTGFTFMNAEPQPVADCSFTQLDEGDMEWHTSVKEDIPTKGVVRVPYADLVYTDKFGDTNRLTYARVQKISSLKGMIVKCYLPDGTMRSGGAMF